MKAGADRFRRMACSFAGASEAEHCGHPDFRVHGRIFATLSAQERGCGVLKLTTEQQAAFIAEMPEIFQPVPGGWGRKGMTLVDCTKADDATLHGALATAHRNVTQKHEAQVAKRSGARRQQGA